MRLERIKTTYSRIVFSLPVESIVWLTGLLILALYDPAHQQHASICVFNAFGIKYCPGCGLGRSIAYFLQGDIAMSFGAHPFGIPAVGILVYRIYTSSKEYIKRLKLKY